MKITNCFQVQLPWFCMGGLVGALLVLSIHYTKFGEDVLPEALQPKCESETLAIGNDTQVKKQDQDPLAEVLKSAAMEGNTVIMTQGNEAWMAPNSLFDLFLEGFRVGEEIEHLLNHLVIVTVDQKGFEKCKTVHKYCYLMRTDNMDLSGEKPYMTKDYLDMCWARNKFQRRILELGYNFLFTDMDILWFRNPMGHIAITSDIAIACDHFRGDKDIDKSDVNGGLLYVKSSKKTIEFFKSWQELRVNFSYTHEQEALNQMRVELNKKFQVRMQFLNTMHISGFCEMSKDLSKVCTMHATCCVGLSPKLQGLRSILEDWITYKSIPPFTKEKEQFQFRNIDGICLHP